MGPVARVVLVVASAMAGAVVGWWAHSSATLGRWVSEAKRSVETSADTMDVGVREAQAPTRRRLPRFVWALAPGLAAAAVAAVAAPGLLAAWASVLTLMALVDAESLVLPRALSRRAAAGVVLALLLVCGGSGDWAPLSRSVVMAAVATSAYGTWWLLARGTLGLGDVRMACFVAMGAGPCSTEGCLAALSAAPLAGALVGKLAGSRRVSSGPVGSRPTSAALAGAAPSRQAGRQRVGAVAVPLGPFLACGGLLVVVGHGI
ncbi:MAG TPA: hypothetical protein VK425_05690 [Acidimicrobiales bacterium]|nr:hypothetical protein [Acidimicrobiales bacterium]